MAEKQFLQFLETISGPILASATNGEDVNDGRFLERYSRQMRFGGIGEKGQRKLLDSRVTLCGCGALGTVLANALVRAGVGHLRIIDRDFIETHNLQRQVLFDEARRGREPCPRRRPPRASCAHQLAGHGRAGRHRHRPHQHPGADARTPT